MKFNTHSEKLTLGTQSNLEIDHPEMNIATMEKMRERAIEERE